MSKPSEDPVLKSSRREAIVVMLVWLAALVYSVTYCWVNGYGRSIDSLTFVLGFPDWVFWGIVTPWVACCLLSVFFAFIFIHDEDLGQEADEEEDHAG